MQSGSTIIRKLEHTGKRVSSSGQLHEPSLKVHGQSRKMLFNRIKGKIVLPRVNKKVIEFFSEK